MQQVLAEQSLRDPRLEVLVGRGNDAHVGTNRRVAADAIELTFGQHPQQAGLQRDRHVADLVEEQRAAVSLLEASAAQRIRARERALLVAEQLRLEQLGGEGRGVERDERLHRSRTVAVQRARNEFLAGA